MIEPQASPRLRARVALVALLALLPFGWTDGGVTGDEGQRRAVPEADAKDWPMYNYDALGTRHNRAESSLDPASVGRLVEKWRFPREGSGTRVGVIHATPIVVNGYVYFGTATRPAFYKVTPDGRLKWIYRNPDLAPRPQAPGRDEAESANSLRQAEQGAIVGSALVTQEAVYFGDLAGYLYALDRSTGRELWKINTRAKEFPGSHMLNMIFSSPILADGKVLVGGGPLEHVAALNPLYPCCTGRGFVVALEPETGKIAWKYDVGPEPRPLIPPVTIEDSYGKHRYLFGPATSSVWSTPSFDAATGTVFFGTDTQNAPRRPTDDDPEHATRYSCAVVAVDVHNGREKWVTQISPGDVWNYSLRGYDPATGRYKDQSLGDTPKLYTINEAGKSTKVVGIGCKNGGFYVLRASDGLILHHTPIYDGPPNQPLTSPRAPRTLALPGLMGGLQTGCATDGRRVFTNGIDAIRLGTQESPKDRLHPPTAGRVVAISLDTESEHWRHERPTIPTIGGPAPKAVYHDVGDPVASGLAIGRGVVFFTTVASGKLVALEADSGRLLKEIPLGPVWSGPSISRGRLYVGTGNTLFNPDDIETYFPKRFDGTLFCFGLPDNDEVDRLGGGDE